MTRPERSVFSGEGRFDRGKAKEKENAGKRSRDTAIASVYGGK